MNYDLAHRTRTMKPSLARNVLYTSLGDSEGKYPSEHQAAIITKVAKHENSGVDDSNEHSFDVSLVIFYPTGIFHMAKVPYSAEFKRGCWTWPPRVSA